MLNLLRSRRRAILMECSHGLESSTIGWLSVLAVVCDKMNRAHHLGWSRRLKKCLWVIVRSNEGDCYCCGGGCWGWGWGCWGGWGCCRRRCLSFADERCSRCRDSGGDGGGGSLRKVREGQLER